MNVKLNRRIRTVQYNDQRFSSTEIDLLHTPALQRLYDLHQLGLADRIFIDASHSRLQHVVGVVEQADKLMQAIIANLEKHPEELLSHAGALHGGITKAKLAEHATNKVMATRLMAMLHDLTHAPYGHTLEDEIELVEQKHDEPTRQADAFYRLVLQYFGWIERNSDSSSWGVDSRQRPSTHDHQALLGWYLDSPDLHEPPTDPAFISFLVQRWTKFVTPKSKPGEGMRKINRRTLAIFLNDLAFAMRALVYLDLAHKSIEKVRAHHVPEREYPVDRLLNLLLQAARVERGPQDTFFPQRDVFLLDVIGNTICADLLDYARRDASNAGLRLDYDAIRIVDNMTVVSSAGPFPQKVDGPNGLVDFPFSDACLRTCVSLFSHKLRTDVPGELLNLLQVRYFVYERMLYHPTKSVAGAVLGAALQFIGWKKLPRHWRFIGDQVFLHQVSDSARLIRDLLSAFPSEAGFTSELAKTLRDKIEALPINGVACAAIQLLDDRVTTGKDIQAQLEVVKRFRNQRTVADLLSPFFREVQSGTLDDETVPMVRRRLDAGHSQTQASLDAIAWLENNLPTVGSVREELKAGLRLLDRIGARRYLKIIFRLLPNARVQGLHGVDAEKIADLFKKPTERKLAEREIERRANLPMGSVVIHCPPVKGPTKIARILIASTDTAGSDHEQKVEMLNNIGGIDPVVFEKHQHAIKALEEMYASTWRFAISVAPPHDAKWKQVNDKVGEVLHELLTGSAGSVKNDNYTVKEITALEAEIIKEDALDRDEIINPSASLANDTQPTSDTATRLAISILAHPEFRDLTLESSDVDIVRAFVAFQKKTEGDNASIMLELEVPKVGGRKLSRGPETSEKEIYDLISECLHIEGLKQVKDDRLRRFVSSARKLGPAGLGALRKELMEFQPPFKIGQNTLRDQNRETMFSTLDNALHKASKADASTQNE